MTLRLVLLAQDHWETLEGYSVAHNMPSLVDLKIERLAAFVYYMFTQNKDEQEVEKFRSDLWMPPATDAATIAESVANERSPWNPENEGRALAGLKAQLGLQST